VGSDEPGGEQGDKELDARHDETWIPAVAFHSLDDVRQAVHDAEDDDEEPEALVHEGECAEYEEGQPDQDNVDPEDFLVRERFSSLDVLVHVPVDVVLEAARPEMLLGLMKEVEGNVDETPEERVRHLQGSNEGYGAQYSQDGRCLGPILVTRQGVDHNSSRYGTLDS